MLHTFFFLKSLNVISTRIAGSNRYDITRARVFSTSARLFTRALACFLTHAQPRRTPGLASTGPRSEAGTRCLLSGRGPPSRTHPPSLPPNSCANQTTASFLKTRKQTSLVLKLTKRFDKEDHLYPFLTWKRRRGHVSRQPQAPTQKPELEVLDRNKTF